MSLRFWRGQRLVAPDTGAHRRGSPGRSDGQTSFYDCFHPHYSLQFALLLPGEIGARLQKIEQRVCTGA